MSSGQVPTFPATTEEIMSSPEFKRGLDDARKGVQFDWRRHDEYWAYERGRLFGFIAPLDWPLRIGRKLNPKAVALCDAAFKRKLIL
jgi:hypothetical protein